MPLIQSASKKAFKKNVETEMKANPSPKDRSQNLAIAYATKRKAKKKMAKGGSTFDPDYEKGVNKQVPENWQGERNMPQGTSYPGANAKAGAILTARIMHKDKLKELKEMKKADIKGLAFGGEVQDDVNKVYERYDNSTSDSEARTKTERQPSGLPLETKNQKQLEDGERGLNDREGFAAGGEVFEPDQDEDAMDDSDHWGSNPNRGAVKDMPGDLGSHVEMLVDKCLATKGMGEREGFAGGGSVPGTHRYEVSEGLERGAGYPAKPSPVEGSRGVTQKESDQFDAMNTHPDQPKKSEHFTQGPPGFGYGGKIEQMVNACIDKKMMSKGGQIVPDEWSDDSGDQTEDDQVSSKMDDDILSEDDYMNENMDNEPGKKKKKLMSSILSEVRGRHMGK